MQCNSICVPLTIRHGDIYFKTKAPVTVPGEEQKRKKGKTTTRTSICEGGSLSTVYFPCDIISIPKHVLQPANRKFKIMLLLALLLHYYCPNPCESSPPLAQNNPPIGEWKIKLAKYTYQTLVKWWRDNSGMNQQRHTHELPNPI